ncbi:MAG: ComF family protein [Cyanothece sp. SIO1E1]|nr:ComF family protein [Cyanothece sp. SIO1E1]
MIWRWTQKLNPILDFFLDANCPLCQRPTQQVLCLDCQQQIKYCQCSHPSQAWQGSLPIFAWGFYKGTLKRAITALKYEHQPQLARPLGHLLAQAWLDHAAALTPLHSLNLPAIVVPIPLHINRQRQRGYNQALLLAESFCNVTQLPLRRQGLLRIQATEAQFRLSARAREQNLTGAFQVDPGFQRQCPPHQQPVLLLDDIYTSGATARSAAQTLRQQGISVCGMVTMALSPKSQTRG